MKKKALLEKIEDMLNGVSWEDPNAIKDIAKLLNDNGYSVMIPGEDY